MRDPHLKEWNEAFIADNATVCGDVTLRDRVSVWYGCVIRGDVAPIIIGEQSNIQDLSLVHPQHDEPVEIGERVTVGHGVMLHCRYVGSKSLIGMGSILLPGVRVGEGAIVAAGALCPIGMEIPDGMVAMGSPAKIVRPVRDAERAMIEETTDRYLQLIAQHMKAPQG